MPSYAYFQNRIVPLEDANLNIMTNFMHYGTGIFEGIRGNKSSKALGVRLHDLDSDFLVFAFPWGRYIDTDRAKCCISSWRFPNEVPRAKITGLYVTNAFAKTEAVENGFDEAIMLTPDGHVAEGSGENIFLVIDGKLVTTPSSDGILVGINRNTVITLAREELGIETVERHVSRNELYTADECFLTGTAVHFVPVTEIDRRKIADGNIGKITAKLQRLFHEVILSSNPKYAEWCTPVYSK